MYKNFFHHSDIKKCFVLLNIRMINLSLDELRLIAQIRNISDYENKSKEDLIKALSEPELTPKQKPETKQKPKPKPEIKINGKKLEEIEEDFYELRHKFSKKKQIIIEKLFMMLKTIDILLNQKQRRQTKILKN